MSVRQLLLPTSLLLISIGLASCGGGGGGGVGDVVAADGTGDDSAADVESSTNLEGDSNDDIGNDSQVAAASACPSDGRDFGGDVIGNEYLESDTITSLLFGDSIGSNEESNSDLVKRLQLNSCASASGLEFGSAYAIKSSRAFAGAIDYAFEVRNVTDRMICDVRAEFNVRDIDGQRIQGSFSDTSSSSGIAESYTGTVIGREAAIQDLESGLLTGEQTGSCLRPNEIGYIHASERGRQALLGVLIFDAFEEAAFLNVLSITFSDDEYVELPPILSISSYASPPSSDLNVQIELEILDVTSEQVAAFEQLIPLRSITSVGVQSILLDSQGQPLYIGFRRDDADTRLAFRGSASSIRFLQSYVINP